MTQLRRRLLLAGVLLILVSVVAGVIFQLTTRSALERAETLRLRRMQVTRQGEDGPYRFFFATNRLVERQDGDFEHRLGNERGNSVQFGFFDTDIEPSLGIGMLVDPTDWFQNQEIQVHAVQPQLPAGFIEELRAQVSASPYRALLVNINGFRERFPSALRKTAFLAHVLDIDAPLLVFDWPGDQGSSPRGYRRAQQVARESGAELAQTLRLIAESVQPERVWLLANSMGGEVVVSAFSQLLEEPALVLGATAFEHVVLTAPDVSHADFGQKFRQEINALAGDLTVYVSSNDRALLMSRVINRERRLGESTVDPANPSQTNEATRVYDLVEPGSDLVTLVDVTPVNRTRNFHNFSLETPEFFDDLFQRFTNPKPPLSRLRYPVLTEENKVYWILTKGR